MDCLILTQALNLEEIMRSHFRRTKQQTGARETQGGGRRAGVEVPEQESNSTTPPPQHTDEHTHAHTHTYTHKHTHYHQQKNKMPTHKTRYMG